MSPELEEVTWGEMGGGERGKQEGKGRKKTKGK